VLNALGVALGRQGKLDEAIECFNEALRIKPDFAEALSNLSHAQALRGGLDKVK
jgi:pentatricopeptide repeat protein